MNIHVALDLPAPEVAPRTPVRAAAVRVQNAGKTFTAGGRANIALDNVSFDVAEGAFVTLIGRSGSGKSTLLRLISGLLAPSAGGVEAYGEAVNGPPRAARYVFQDFGESLFPWLSARDNVAFGARAAASPEGRPRDVAEHYLAMVGLADAADRYPWELSGGMQQRLAIARALASRPRLLLMDEPFGAVDALSRARLQDLILRLWRELSLTIILVTHDIEEAVYLSDRVIVLDPIGHGVRGALDIEIERPRAQLATREHPRFAEYRRALHTLVLE